MSIRSKVYCSIFCQFVLSRYSCASVCRWLLASHTISLAYERYRSRRSVASSSGVAPKAK